MTGESSRPNESFNWSINNIEKADLNGRDFLASMQGELVIVLKNDGWENPVMPEDNENALKLKEIIETSLGVNVESSPSDFAHVLENLLISTSVDSGIIDMDIKEGSNPSLAEKIVTVTRKNKL